MFDIVTKMFKKDPFVPVVGEPTAPDKTVLYRAWVIINEDGRVGYIDHYKQDGKFGVRPVNFDTGLHYPNPSQHWTNEQRLKVPEELSLYLREFRAAEAEEIPTMYRGNLAH
jgi:hypothetical protein